MFKPFVRIPVPSVITGLIIHFMFHIHSISVHKLLYFSFFFFSAFFLRDISVHWYFHIYQYSCLLLLLLLLLLFGSRCKNVLTKKFCALFQANRRQRLTVDFWFWISCSIHILLFTHSDNTLSKSFCANYWCSCIRYLLSSALIYSACFEIMNLCYCQLS
jgi:hypothetical protein